MMTLNWQPDPENGESAQRVGTRFGIYRIRPRADGCWEYMTPDCENYGDHKNHRQESLKLGQMFGRVSDEIRTKLGHPNA